MDNLEKFIHEQREAFDTAVPSLKVWSNIDRHLEQRPQHKVVWMKRLRMAAAVALLLVAGGIGGAYLSGSGEDAQTLADVSPEHADTERHFQEQIDRKMVQLAAYRQDGFVKSDLQELDDMYKALQKELEQAPEGGKDQIIQAMIENYQTRIDILERVLEKVQSTPPTNLKNEENEVSL